MCRTHRIGILEQGGLEVILVDRVNSLLLMDCLIYESLDE